MTARRRRSALADGTARSPAIRSNISGPTYARQEALGRIASCSAWRRRMGTGDLTDAEWELVGPLLPPERGRPGRPGHDNRRILDGILWRAREGARWRAVPERYGRRN